MRFEYLTLYHVISALYLRYISIRLDKKQLLNFGGLNVYLFDQDQGHDVNWLLDIVNQVGTIILDVDNTRNEYQCLIGYLLSFDKTYYLTKAEEMSYNVINTRRIYDVRQITEENGSFVKIQGQT